ncbi:hypothetical protein JHK86_015426 [Glycine max]|nr:hypothetical protein JHK86_015426 [Glycine max]
MMDIVVGFVNFKVNPGFYPPVPTFVNLLISLQQNKKPPLVYLFTSNFIAENEPLQIYSSY